MNNIEESLKGIYRDLRNQRLLPVIAILLVAIVAVPIALGAGGKQAAPQTELAVGIQPLTSSQPVVLQATPELRNFQKRLNKFAKKNPFHQPQPTVVAKKSSNSSSDAAATGTSTTTTTTTSATGTSTPTDTGTTPTDTGTTTPTDTGTTTTPTDTGTTTTPTDTGGTGTGNSSGSGSGKGSGSTDILSHQIDVSAGPVGEEKDLTGVESLDFLPDVKYPVLQYVSSSPNGLKASFVVSSKVVRVVGDGRCSPSPTDCQFLQLKVGQAERMDYGTDNGLYRVKLLGITQILNPLKKLSAAAGDVSGRISFSAGLSG